MLFTRGKDIVRASVNPAYSAHSEYPLPITPQDFVADAFAHCKFMGLSPEAKPLLVKAGIAEDLDDGCMGLQSADDAKAFVAALGPLRFWDRESKVDLDAMTD